MIYVVQSNLNDLERFDRSSSSQADVVSMRLSLKPAWSDVKCEIVFPDVPVVCCLRIPKAVSKTQILRVSRKPKS